ncbi:MAG: FecR domain-containing protein [Bacteroidetes bacterium]|nr:FecR domain-containing protein [Bacteroidota bacterium]
MQDWELIGKYVKGEASQEERVTVEQWLKADKANESLFEEIKASWASAAKLNQHIKIDKAKAWNSIQQKIKEEEKIIPISRKAPAYNSWVLRAAAILIVGLFATWYGLKVNNKPDLILVQTTNETKTVVLPDSSIIILNENSRLIYPKEFAANERHVDLEGEAFFEVTKDPKKPFIIDNKHFDVKVLGTSFNVQAYEKDVEATVTVVTGKVAFTDKKGGSVLLIKDEVGTLNKTGHQLNKTNNLNSNFLSWKAKKLEFTNTNFSEVCAAIKKYFSVEIVVKDKNILNCTFTGYFENPKLPDVLKVLEKTLNIKTVVIEKNVEITGKGC